MNPDQINRPPGLFEILRGIIDDKRQAGIADSALWLRGGFPDSHRTQVGAEIDMVLEKGGKPEMAIEVKRSMAPSPEKGFAIPGQDRVKSQSCDPPSNLGRGVDARRLR